MGSRVQTAPIVVQNRADLFHPEIEALSALFVGVQAQQIETYRQTGCRSNGVNENAGGEHH
jgi:hypothetical protein